VEADEARSAARPPRAVVSDVTALDRAVYEAVAETPTPLLDSSLATLSRFADNGKLWLSIAGVLGIAGGRRGRRAAALGAVSLGAASAVVNTVGKGIGRRRRPDRAGVGVPEARHVKMPSSTSFPSGHSASAFAFATGATHAMPLAGVPLQLLAATVAYSRVHTGVHYPVDVIVGSAIGAATGGAVVAAAVRRRERRA
jgi:undecaprenyl-diphosphatase